MREITLKTNSREELVDITREVEDAVSASGVQSGVCHLHCLHTTAGLTINENADPDVKTDLLMALRRVVQDGWHYYHAEGNSPAHIKSSLVGVSLAIPISEGRLALGTWQGVVFCEFDGPRARKVAVAITRAE
jgi:secondary thiamine-phosphate synthase enzyme